MTDTSGTTSAHSVCNTCGLVLETAEDAEQHRHVPDTSPLTDITHEETP